MEEEDIWVESVGSNRKNKSLTHSVRYKKAVIDPVTLQSMRASFNNDNSYNFKN